MCGLFLFAPLEGVAQKFTVIRKSLSCTVFRSALCFGNIPFPLAERSCLDCEEYFGTAQIEFQFTANCARRSTKGPLLCIASASGEKQ